MDIAATLTHTPDYYSDEYKYLRYPAQVDTGRGYPEHGTFQVWLDFANRNCSAEVTWSPETVALVAKEYQNEAWHAERAERAARPLVERLQLVRCGDLVVEVPKRAGTYTTGIPCRIVGRYELVEA